MGGRAVVFFVSSGRCGTQWLASSFANVSSGAVVAHEPIDSRYRSADHYRHYETATEIFDRPDVATHVRNTERHRDEGVTYIETGWPSYGAIPALIARFGDDIALVHLVRHPVATARSLATTIWNWSTPGWRIDEWNELSLPHPDRHNVFQREYRGRFHELSPFEQCLFWWTELQRYVGEIAERFPTVPMIRVRAEDLFKGDRAAFEHLLRFLGLPWSDEILRSPRVDAFTSDAPDIGDPRAIEYHPSAVATAADLGYDPLGWDRPDH